MKASIIFLTLVLANVVCLAQPLFELRNPQVSGVDFINRIEESEEWNVLAYEYFYNGGGVAVGDFNNDGLPDIYFTANQGENKLYLNKGNLTFKDIAEDAGVKGRTDWATGVTLVDINSDGWLDIYVCYSGKNEPETRRNELYVNQGNLTFIEQAKAYGIDDNGNSTHASFFDYDNDGDLDLFVLNHSIKRYTQIDAAHMRQQHDPYAGDHLYKNEKGKYIDVTQEAGIYANPIGFGLSVSVADINQDGWLDIYVTNDYIEDDYLYINQKNGTFKEQIRAYLRHTSYFSMGSDIADFNNDGLLDIITLDMLPEDNKRQKLLQGAENYDLYLMTIAQGYHPQFMRNMLHLNLGDDTFSEIGQLAGISNTDWSWSSLFADFDLDGYKDLFVSNGYMRDYTNMDFLKYTYAEAKQKAKRSGKAFSLYEMVKRMPSTKIANYWFRNNGDLTFEKKSGLWAETPPSLSSGVAYGDLDNDGDLDLVVNNINEIAFVYENKARQQHKGNYLKVKLIGVVENTQGIGATVTVLTKTGKFTQTMMPSRGFQSSVEPVLLFGIGDSGTVSVHTQWQDGTVEMKVGIKANQTIEIKQNDAQPVIPAPPIVKQKSHFQLAESQPVFNHSEDYYIDFKREPLLPHLLSQLGPALAIADVNKDGLEDIFVGGAAGQSAALFIQQLDGTFVTPPQPIFESHKDFEDNDAIFFDADNDGDQDLYVVSGGNIEEEESEWYLDRLYINTGFGRFEYVNALPNIRNNGGVVVSQDIDFDGDLDLFIGGRVRSGQYPVSPNSYLLENIEGVFRDITPPSLRNIGMVSDAIFANINESPEPELIVVGEWTPIQVFTIEEGTYVEITDSLGLKDLTGWWNCITASDLDNDGDLDLIVGNMGLNSQLKASSSEPATLFASDYDGNGSFDPIISYYIQGKSYPMAQRDEILDQMNGLKRRFTNYASYASMTTDELLSEEQRKQSLRLTATTFETFVLENTPTGFKATKLPYEVQFAPTNCILVEDINKDGYKDLILAGNNYPVRSQLGRYDASPGWVLFGKGNLSFSVLYPKESGFKAFTDVRKMAFLKGNNSQKLVVANNNAPLSLFEIR